MRQRQHFFSRTLLALYAASALIGCSDRDAPGVFFPLEPGMTWVYEVTTEQLGQETRTDYESQAFRADLDRDDVPDAPDGPYWARRDSYGSEYFFARTESGIERIAKRRIVDSAPLPDLPRRPVLPLPAREGATWQVESFAYLIGKTGTYGDHTEASWPVRMAFSVLALDAEVETAAGVFSNCLLVEGTGSVELYLDGRRGFVEVPVTQTEWYAPGVGLVKLVREEEVAESDRFYGGTRTFELVYFED